MDRKRKKRSWRRVTNALSCLIVFCTTYALILPALTLETEAQQFYCDKEEHTHTEDCYHSKDPLCGKEEGEAVEGHIHDDSCYEIKQTLICPLEESEEHVHDESCFQQEQVLICDKEESESVEGHEHSPKCYLSVDPVCGKEEHTHSKECTSNKDLKEKKEDWENSIPETLSDKLDEKIVQIAKSQKDYKEVKENFELDSDGKEHYYTRYGEWYGKPYEDWNIMFSSFVLHYAGIKNEQIPYGHDWNEWIEDLSKKELFEPEGYEPQNGDLIFFKDQKDENVPDKEIKSYVGFLVNQDKNKAIVGDLNDQVKEIVLQEKEYETMAYVHPEQEVQEVEDEKQPTEQDPVVEDGKEEPAEEEKEDKNEETKEEIEYRLPEEFKVETEDFTLTLKPRSIPGEQEEEQKEENKQPEEESKEQEETEKTTDNELQIKKFSLEPEENIQDKIDEEINRSEDELEQIQEEAKQEQEEEENKPIPTLQIEKIDETTQNEEDQLEIQKLKEQSEKDTDPEQLLDLSFYKLRFFVEDQEINLEDQKFDAELTPTQAFVEKYDTTKDLEDVKPEAEVGASVSIMNINKTVETDLIDAETANDSILINKNYTNTPIVFSQNASDPMVLNIQITPNPEFEVEIYGYLHKNQEATYEDLNQDKTTRQNATFQVIDMTKIPEKFASGFVKYKDYKNVQGKFNKVLGKEPEEIYSSTKYKFHQAPSLDYFNKLDGVESYCLKEIWIKPNGQPNWSKFNYNSNDLAKNIRFTNSNLHKDLYDPQQPDDYEGKYYLITEGTEIRLVFNETESKATEKTSFWDYDFYDTNLNIHTNNDGRVGINNENNYSSTEAPTLVLGNKYISQKFYSNDPKVNVNKNGKSINQSAGNLEFTTTQTVKDNNNNTKTINVKRVVRSHPIFGLVNSTLGSDGHLQYAVNAPKLFDEGTAIGKSVRLDGSLKFDRTGDTYSLYGVSGPNNYNKDTLNQFLTKDAYTPAGQQKNRFHYNGFWPLDNFDKTKNYGSQNNQPQLKYNGNTYDFNGTYKSDDDQDHNTLFGMKYQVDFILDENYTGPLRYFFYGDDDMWVFLDDQLICDIGGVHQTIGAEVDIRQALGDTLSSGKHTLTVYYLERGQAGSSCYMEYTLPNVVSKTPENATGELRLEKQSNDPDPDKDYEFEIELSDQNRNELANEYALTVYTKSSNGNDIIDEKRSNVTFHSRGKILLKNNQYAIIKYLPINSNYKITENINSNEKDLTFVSSCLSTGNACDIKQPEVKPENGTYTIIGTITSGSSLSHYVKVFNNKYFALPETGGIGIEPPIMASGISLIATSGYVVILRKKGWWSKKKK